MTLIRIFGQVQSDNRIFNLSPFEIRYNENRGFFTEELSYSTKEAFYSRRIGGLPVNFDKPYNEAASNESVIKESLLNQNYSTRQKFQDEQAEVWA